MNQLRGSSRVRAAVRTAGQHVQPLLPTVLLGLYYALLLPGWNLRLIDYTTLDGAWHAVLNAFIAQDLDLRFGSDFIYTIGPLGFLRREWYYPGNQIYHVLWGLVLSGAFALAYHRLFRGLPVFYRWLGLLAFLLIPSLVGPRPGKLLSLIPVLFFYVRLAADSRRLSFADLYLSFVLATSAWVVFPQLVLSSFVVFAITILHYLSFKKLSYVPVFFVTFLIGWWLALDQSLGDLPAYVKYGIELSQGYGEVMLQYRSWWQVLAILVAFSLYLTSSALYGDSTRVTVKVALMVVMSGTFFLVFKQAFVRHSQVRIIVPAALVVAMTVCHLAYVRRLGHQRLRLRWLAAPISVALLVNVWFLSPALGDFGRVLRSRARWHQRQAWSAWNLAESSAALRRGDARRRQKARDQFPLPPLREAVDWFGNRHGILVAHGLEGRFRPLFQQLVAYTQGLAELNAEFYRSPRAPRLVIVDLSAKEGALRKSLLDARALVELLQSYDTAGRYGELLLLSRRSREPFTFTEISQRTIEFGEDVKIDAYSEEHPIWVEIDVHSSWLGRLTALAFKPPMLWLHLRLGNGREGPNKFAASPARGGFLLSPRIMSTGHFESLISQEYPAWTPRQRVLSFRLEASTASRQFLLRGARIRISTIRRHADLETMTPSQPSGSGEP